MQQLPPNSSLSPRTWVDCDDRLRGRVRLAIYCAGRLPAFHTSRVIAPFGGAYFADRRLAFIVPPGAMLVADAIIAATLSPAWIGDWLGRPPSTAALTTRAATKRQVSALRDHIQFCQRCCSSLSPTSQPGQRPRR